MIQKGKLSQNVYKFQEGEIKSDSGISDYSKNLDYFLKLDASKFIIINYLKFQKREPMQTSLNTPRPSPQKIKNILIRHSCSKRMQENGHYQHPETSYILKYAPKYYKSLTIQATCQSPLQSKVKKIKKLKVFTGYFDRHLSQKLWFNLLGNNRKEIEEFPQISSNKMRVRPSKAFWEKLNQQKLKNFWNVTRIWLPKWRESYLIDNLDNFLSSKERFVKYLWGLRRLKSLKIMAKDSNYDEVKWVLAKLNRMGRLLSRLETLSLDVRTYNNNIQEFFQNKTFFSHLTGLGLFERFDPIFAEILFTSKNLNSLSLDFESGVDQKPEFTNFLTSMQHLSQLKRLQFDWPTDGKPFWSHFKPQPSLEYFLLRVEVHELTDAGFLEEDKAEDLVGHWEDLKELRVLEFSLSCSNPEDFNVVRLFMTRMLKKVQKLKTLKLWVGAPLENDGSHKTYEPFLVEDVPHLYETLERFEYQLSSWTDDRFAKFDLKVLEPFRNLRSLKLEGNVEYCENLEGIVSVLEGNQKYPELELNLRKSTESPADWLRSTLKNLESTKRAEKNLKIIIDLTIGLKDYIEILQRFCDAIQSAKTIKGLGICLNLNEYVDDYPQLAIEQVRELLSRYPGIRNLEVRLSNGTESLEFIKIDGEKEQFFVNTDE